MTFYIGGARSANKILEHQKRELKSTKKEEVLDETIEGVENTNDTDTGTTLALNEEE